jgi:L-alanine-DL-glutamate epimerase-like enolase superfamily enzyme
MGESVVSVAAALAFALAHGNVRWADLDSPMSLTKDVAPPLRFEGGDLVAPDAPGLGVRIEPDLFD